MIDDSDDGAKQVGWARRTVDLLDKYFGPTFQNFGEIAADRTSLWKLKNRLGVMEKFEKLRKESEVGNLREISARIGFPMIEALETESDETLQDVWARLIKNATDPKKPVSLVSRHLIDIVRKLEPVDLLVLNNLFDHDLETPVRHASQIMWMESPFKTLSMDELLEILDRLASLGLLRANNDGGMSWAPSEKYSAPAQLLIWTPSGKYLTQHLLLVLKRALATA